MPRRDTIVVGASAGGVEALRTLISGLPPGLAASILVVLHTPPSEVSALASILSRVTELSVAVADEGLSLRPGSVIVARPDHHLLVNDSHVSVVRGPRESGHRPAVDVLFRSAARALGSRVIGVVLSGALDDGAAGAVAIRSRGGMVIVQDPDDAQFPGMPRNAIAAAAPEQVLPVSEIPPALAALVGQRVGPAVGEPSELMETEVAIAGLRPGALDAEDRPGDPAGLSCPDCHGPLFEIKEGGFLRYRCRIGHAWSPQSLLFETDAALESALWMALRALDEKASLARRAGARMRAAGHMLSAERTEEEAEEASAATGLLRKMLLEGGGGRGQVRR